MSRTREQWLAARRAAQQALPRPTISRVTATRRLRGGWEISIEGDHLVPLGSPGWVSIGGETLEQVKFGPNEVTGVLRQMPSDREIRLNTAIAQVSATPLRITRHRQSPIEMVARLVGSQLEWIRSRLSGTDKN